MMSTRISEPLQNNSACINSIIYAFKALSEEMELSLGGEGGARKKKNECNAIRTWLIYDKMI